MEKQTMGAFISALRKSKGITQKELAELLSVSDKAVSRWECDQTVPDISLLPLIADVFEITVDELIRGARIKNEQPTESQEKGIQKRLESILETKFNSYKTKSIVPIVLVIIGLISAFICESFGYVELGAGIALILFVCSIACQIFFLLNFKNSVNTNELNNDILLNYKKKIFDFSFWVFTALFSFEALILSFDYHLFWWCGPLGVVAVLLIAKLVKSLFVKKLNLPFAEKDIQNSKLFIKVFVSFACVVGVLIASMITINVNCENWIEKPEVFYVTDSTEEIENYIENQLLVGYGECYYPLDDEEIDNEIKVTIAEDDIIFSDVIEYSCLINRYKVNDVEKDGKSCKEVSLWTISTRIKSRTILDNINIAYFILYFICIIIAIFIYIKKSMKNRNAN